MHVRGVHSHVSVALMLALIFSFASPLLAIPTPGAPLPLLILSNAGYTLPEARAGQPYQFQFESKGGLAPLSWRVAAGELPFGLQLDAAGKLSGTPQQARRAPYRFVIEVADSTPTPERVSQECWLTIQPEPLRIVMRQPLRIVMPAAAPMPARFDATDLATARAANASNGETRGGGPLVSAVAEGSLPAPAAPSAGAPPPVGERRLALQNASSAAATPTESESAKTFKVCGRLRPASLDQVVSLILRSNLQDPIVRENLEKAGFDKVSDNNSSSFSCAEYFKEGGENGEQRKAVVVLLNRVLHLVRKGGDQTATLAAKRGQGDEPANKLLFTTLYNTAGISEATLEKLIERVTNYVGSVRVYVKDDDGKIVATTTADRDGRYLVELANNNKATSGARHYMISTSANDHHSVELAFVNNTDQQVNLLIDDRPVSLLTRAVVGYQQSGAASSEFEQNYFFDLFVSQTLPMKLKIDPDFGERWRSWVAARSASLPQNGDVTVNGLALSFADKVGDLKVRDAARVFDVLGGLEFRLLENRALLPSFARDTKQKFSLSLIGSFGFVTPTDPTNLPPIFKLTSAIRQKLLATTTLDAQERTNISDPAREFLSFVNVDRDRFFRQYYAGVRVQTFFFNRHDVPMQRFPAQFDLTFGQNEYVTGGRMRGGVIRFDGYFPLPYEGLKFINLYGTAIIKPARAAITNGILLEPVTAASIPIGATVPTIGDPRVLHLARPQFNRDYYKVGVGIDFVSFIGALRKPKPAGQ